MCVGVGRGGGEMPRVAPGDFEAGIGVCTISCETWFRSALLMLTGGCAICAGHVRCVAEEILGTLNQTSGFETHFWSEQRTVAPGVSRFSAVRCLVDLTNQPA